MLSAADSDITVDGLLKCFLCLARNDSLVAAFEIPYERSLTFLLVGSVICNLSDWPDFVSGAYECEMI